MYFDIDLLKSSTYLDMKELEHLSAINDLLDNLDKMINEYKIFENFNIHNFTIDLELCETKKFPDRKCYTESFSAFDKFNEYVVDNAVYEELEKFIKPINNLYCRYLNQSDYVATLPIYLADNDYCKADIVSNLVNDELLSKISAASLAKDLSDKSINKKNKLKI